MLKAALCPVCGSDRLATRAVLDAAHPGDDVDAHLTDATWIRQWILCERMVPGTRTARFELRSCLACGFMFQTPRFTDAEIGAKYAALDELGSTRRILALTPPLRTDERSRRTRAFVEETTGPFRGRVLDIGGGTGDNLRAFLPDCSCAVVDMVPMDLPPGVEFRGPDVAALPPDERFDLVLLQHVLEHVSDPVATLSSAAARLEPAGALYVEVPLGVFREWQVVTEPVTHVNYFAEQSLAACAEAAGLVVHGLSTDWQWLLHGELWCVNMVARPAAAGPPARPPRPRLAREQEGGLRLFLPLALRKLRRLFHREGTSTPPGRDMPPTEGAT